jgi:uncharacterized protein (DUF1800 family)
MTIEDAGHLLRRAGFGGSQTEVAALAALDRAAAVDSLLNAAPPAEQLPAEFNDPNKGDYERLIALNQMWFDRMATSPAPAVEKMTLFWHGHFTTSYEKVGNTRFLYDQLAFYRANAFGNFATLTQGMAILPAMLVFLDGDYNQAGHPNQNFARELMELFTLGIGNYTEQDVIEGARAWTGYNLSNDGQSFLFRSNVHDKANKTIFGITKNWDGPMMIDEILKGSKKDIAARYIARKLWEFFAHPVPPAGVVDALATVFLSSGLDLKALMRAMLLRDEFYSVTAKQNLVRTPIEAAVATMRSLGLAAMNLDLPYHCANEGQEPFNPPNVSGWRPNGYWISTSTAAARAAMVWHVLDVASQSKKLPDFTKQAVDAAVDGAFAKAQAGSVSPVARDAVRTWLSGVRTATNYFGDERFDLMFLVLMSPDLQVN